MFEAAEDIDDELENEVDDTEGVTDDSEMDDSEDGVEDDPGAMYEDIVANLWVTEDLVASLDNLSDENYAKVVDALDILRTVLTSEDDEELEQILSDF